MAGEIKKTIFLSMVAFSLFFLVSDTSGSTTADEFESALVPTGIAMTFEDGEVSIDAKELGVRVRMELDDVTDVNTGELVSTEGNKLIIIAAVDGGLNPFPVEGILFDIVEGDAKIDELFEVSGTFLSIQSISVVDAADAQFATVGIALVEEEEEEEGGVED
jgi:hypothetical protein